MPIIGQYYEWTNTVFERLATGSEFYKKYNKMIMSPCSYEALAPLGSMLACALGISEVEFAKIKDEGKSYEDELFSKMFPYESKDGINHGIELIEKVKNIFNYYKLDTYFSLNKKLSNQKLANELYSQCIDLMQFRIENQLQSGTIQDIEEYKKYQMFYLRKMNSNFKYATNHDGFRFSRVPIVHDIGFCNDKISRTDLKKIQQRESEAIDFGFTEDSLWKYSKAIVTSKEENNFYKRLQVTENFQNRNIKDDAERTNADIKMKSTTERPNREQ